MAGQGDEPGCAERADDSECEDRHRGTTPEASEADMETAVEEDDDERDHADALHDLDGEGVTEALDGGREEASDKQEDRCVWK